MVGNEGELHGVSVVIEHVLEPGAWARKRLAMPTGGAEARAPGRRTLPAGRGRGPWTEAPCSGGGGGALDLAGSSGAGPATAV